MSSLDTAPPPALPERGPLARAVNAAALTLFTATGAALCIWMLRPSLGVALAVGYPLILVCLIWWRSSRAAPGRWRLTALIALILAGLVYAAFEAAGLRGLEPSGRLGWAVLAVVFYLPAVITATDDPRPSRS
ncbi:hypothetical protein ACOQFV_24095 [Nocardiopsis changdeensis]|uniref:DUF2568 domain-containing protein n=1 Tax=Nocardiopsis changdeensis TaxID=2831969 RepID=A0A975KUJ1_9ACTN|nr:MULTISPECIES: hypothetical protein [Nocardiopsis]QUX26523.1 hypothetical protein KGD84_33025 [Nocardiopsis changdeensis]QYX40642.1 hypothetical protein K1J57_32095 [Nocardiopsis sp. MT53]